MACRNVGKRWATREDLLLRTPGSGPPAGPKSEMALSPSGSLLPSAFGRLILRRSIPPWYGGATECDIVAEYVGRPPLRLRRAHHKGADVKIVLVVAATLLISSGAFGETGFLDRSVTFQGERYSYQVYVPANYTPASSWPVIVFLHGNGVQGDDGMKPT